MKSSLLKSLILASVVEFGLLLILHFAKQQPLKQDSGCLLKQLVKFYSVVS
nr:hypothetical protein [Mycoplasmopsis bovis]